VFYPWTPRRGHWFGLLPTLECLDEPEKQCQEVLSFLRTTLENVTFIKSKWDSKLDCVRILENARASFDLAIQINQYKKFKPPKRDLYGLFREGPWQVMILGKMPGDSLFLNLRNSMEERRHDELHLYSMKSKCFSKSVTITNNHLPPVIRVMAIFE